MLDSARIHHRHLRYTIGLRQPQPLTASPIESFRHRSRRCHAAWPVLVSDAGLYFGHPGVRVRQFLSTFQVDVSVQTLFEQPTVGELASVVREWDAQPAAEPDTVIRALEHVERLSEEEMQALLNSQRDTGEHDRSGSSGR